MRTKFLLLFTLATLLCNSEVKLASIFSDSMILQQQSDVSIWGIATPVEKITIQPSWVQTDFVVIVNNDSTWKVKIPTPNASFSQYTITFIQGSSKVIINNILIGEVWLCSGQSNMEMPMNGLIGCPVLGATEEIISSANNAIRFFTVKREYALSPKQDLTGRWNAASPQTTGSFSAAGYFFAKFTSQVLKVPIGIINSSYGGTGIETWMSKESILPFGFKKTATKESEMDNFRKEPSVLYNAMISPIVGYSIRGVLWYQGENNRSDYKKYPSLFAAMHQDWQKRWDIENLPIYLVQLAPHNSGNGVSVLMREAQEKIAKTQKNTGIAILTDIGESDQIHPSNKKTVGERLAYLALGKTYFPLNKNFNPGMQSYQSPEFDYMEIKENIATLYFKNVVRGFTDYGKMNDSIFEIAGKNQIFYPAIYNYSKQANSIQVSAPEVDKPVAVRYAFKDFVVGTLYSTEGFPLSSFRTDDWAFKMSNSIK